MDLRPVLLRSPGKERSLRDSYVTVSAPADASCAIHDKLPVDTRTGPLAGSLWRTEASSRTTVFCAVVQHDPVVVTRMPGVCVPRAPCSTQTFHGQGWPVHPVSQFMQFNIQ